MSQGHPPSATVARNRRKSIAAAIAVAIIVAICSAAWLVSHSRSDSTSTSSSAPTNALKSGSSKSGASKSGVPQRVITTLALVDAGRWPEAANSPGTQGGRQFRNNEGKLPRKDASGKAMRYQEWDVNPKARNRGRDAERIITAADGSAWYTLDHYQTFINIRGPNS